MTFTIKRIYEHPSADDGYRVLVDRLWPRGVSKVAAELDEWLKDVAPSTELRVWFDHDPARFPEFMSRYVAELVENPAVDALRQRGDGGNHVTLLYGAKDPAINHAVVLQGFLLRDS
ncbi:MAG TPA: DUF488 domain-containing protein [Galbitalea sp.]|jgi:uncharacterized protein YeaO (DUF488 family)